MKEKDYETWLSYKIIDFVMFVVRYITLTVGVIFAGFTIGYLIMLLVDNGASSLNIVEEFALTITSLSANSISSIVNEAGESNFAVYVFSYGFAASISLILLYIIICKTQIFIRNIFEGSVFSKETINLINCALPTIFTYAFFKPAFMKLIEEITGIEKINYGFSGIAFICIAFIIRFIVEKGYESSKKADKYDKLKEDAKAQEEENSLILLNKDAQIKELKEELKSLQNELENSKKVVETKSKVKESSSENNEKVKKVDSKPKKSNYKYYNRRKKTTK